MKLKIAAAALIALATASGAAATPSLSYAIDAPSLSYSSAFTDFGADVTEAKFKFKKFGGHRGFGRKHFRGKKFGHSKRYGHYDKKVVKKGHGSFVFGKGVFFK